MCCGSGSALDAGRSSHADIVLRGGIGAVERSLQVRVFARARARASRPLHYTHGARTARCLGT